MLNFFDRFNDENLSYYINKAIDNNHSAKQATLRVEQYRQQVKYSFGRELPTFGVSANYLGIKVPELDNFSLSKNAFILPFSVNYEADFLLKNRDKTKSQKKVYEVSKFNEKAIYLALLADVATVYTNICEYDELIKLANEQVDIYTKILSSNSKKLSRGTINTEQYNNSQKNLETARINLQNLKKQQEVLLMQLAVLTGTSANEADNLTRGSFDKLEYCTKIPNEIDSDVIFSRPDVLAAENELEKAKIDIRIARKEFLQIIRDPSSIIIIAFILPLISILIYMYGINLDSVKVTMEIKNDDNSPEVTTLVKSFGHSKYVNSVSVDNMSDIEKMIMRSKIKGAVVIPNDFSKNIKLKNQQLFRFLQMEDRQMSQVLQVLTQHKLLRASARKYLRAEVPELTSLQGIGLTRTLSINGIF